MLQMSGLGTTRTNVHNDQYAKDVENMTCITTAKKTTSVLTAKETMALVLEIVKYGRKKKITKLKHTQNITYPEARRMVKITKYAEMTKNIPTAKK